MQNLDFDKYYEAPEPGRRERAFGRLVDDLFAEKSYYFRNALVRASYENVF